MAYERPLQPLPLIEAGGAGKPRPEKGVISPVWVLVVSGVVHVAILGAAGRQDSKAVSLSSTAAEIAIDTFEPPPPIAPPRIEAPRAPMETSPAKVPPAHHLATAPAPTPATSPPPSVGAAAPAPRFTIALPTDPTQATGAEGLGTAPATTRPSAVAGSGEEGGDEGPVGEGAVDAPASLVSSGALPYPEAARLAGIEADVGLEITVSRSGLVESAKVVQRAGYGLDEAALTATRALHFKAAMRRGRAVRVRMHWNVAFRLQ